MTIAAPSKPVSYPYKIEYLFVTEMLEHSRRETHVPNVIGIRE